MLYLLDTNIIIHYIRVSVLASMIDGLYAPLEFPNRAMISVVSVGELKAIAIKNKWGKRKLEKMTETLSQLIIVNIYKQDILNRYAEIDAFSQGRLDSKKSNFTARNMGKNDLWIAATATVLDATLLTTDNDFNHLHNEFLQVAKIDLKN